MNSYDRHTNGGMDNANPRVASQTKRDKGLKQLVFIFIVKTHQSDIIDIIVVGHYTGRTQT